MRVKRPPHIRVLLAISLPLLVGLPVSALLQRFLNIALTPRQWDLLAIGIVALVMGLVEYDREGLGLRGARPLMSSIGFAFMGWVVLLLARFIAVFISGSATNLGIIFLKLLLIEAFCVQIWTFGLIFRAVAEWRTPVTAMAQSGIVYGVVAFLFFGEASIAYSNNLSLLFFLIWGVFYGVIRLRTGSLLGTVLVQALQSLTVWHFMLPQEPISLGYLYGIAGVGFLFFTWRLLPKYQSDLRV